MNRVYIYPLKICVFVFFFSLHYTHRKNKSFHFHMLTQWFVCSERIVQLIFQKCGLRFFSFINSHFIELKSVNKLFVKFYFIKVSFPIILSFWSRVNSFALKRFSFYRSVKTFTPFVGIILVFIKDNFSYCIQIERPISWSKFLNCFP